VAETQEVVMCGCGKEATERTFGMFDGLGVPVKICGDCDSRIKQGQKTTSMRELLDLLREMIDQQFPHEEGLYIPWIGDDAKEFSKINPRDYRYRWISCYAVTGGNEGWYVHIDFVLDGYGEEGKVTVQHAASLKTFNGRARAYEVALRCAELLGA
jgi:hypothetical protein